MRPDVAASFATIPLDADLPGAIAHREGRMVFSPSQVQAERDFPELRDAARSADGFAVVPLLLGDRSLGVLGLGYRGGIPDAEDLALLEMITGQVAQTLARVRLAERERRRRQELEFLTHLTDVALRSETLEELMDDVAAAAVPTMGDWCTLYFLPEDGGRAAVAVAHVDPDRTAWARDLRARFPVDRDQRRGIAEVVRSGKTEFIPAVTGDLIDEVITQAKLDPDVTRPIVESFALTSVITVPLLTKRRVVGAMQFMSAESGRRYEQEDVALAEAVAGRLAEAMEGASLSDQHRYIAVTLQRALLPPRLPVVPGIETAAHYWPAGGTEVGGDFYDLFALDDHRWAILVGDACGTGPNAAALTSIARHTVRAAARHGMSHTDVVDWLNEAIARSDRDLFCTACYATLERNGAEFRLRTVTAGHPLPIWLSKSQGAVKLGAPGTLLGVFDSVSTHEGDAVLEPGDAVIFYTDGLTDLPPPFGLSADELLDLVAPLVHRPSAASIADDLRELVLGRVPDPRRQDDVAILVIRVADDEERD
jgi:serine phosphatase RsbU (regulator of sigma subunit)